MKSSFMSLIVFVLSVTAGCGPSISSDTASSSSAAISEASTKTNVRGTWQDPSYSRDGAPFQSITLASDGTYRWTAPCGAENCLSIETSSGTWSVKEGDKSSFGALGAYQIELVDTFQQKTTYFVEASEEKMTLSMQSTTADGDLTIGQSFGFTAGSDSDAGSCQVNSDCTGALPRDVVTCSDGSTSGASWQCSAGTCEIAYCSN